MLPRVTKETIDSFIATINDEPGKSYGAIVDLIGNGNPVLATFLEASYRRALQKFGSEDIAKSAYYDALMIYKLLHNQAESDAMSAGFDS